MRTPKWIPHVLVFSVLMAIVSGNNLCRGQTEIAPDEREMVARWKERGAHLGINKGRVIVLALSGKQFGDLDLADVAKLPHLVSLFLESPRFTDEGIKDLGSLKELQFLGLSGTAVTGHGLSQLGGLEELTTIWVNGPNSPYLGSCDLDANDRKAIRTSTIDNDGCRMIAANLGHLRYLSCLVLFGADIDDDALKHLAKMNHLQELVLSFTNVSDAGFADLSRIKQLKRLCLAGTKVDGSKLGLLQQLPVLATLMLDHTSVSDESATMLPQFPRLTTITLDKTKVSKSVYEQLQRDMPFTSFLPAITDKSLPESIISSSNPDITSGYRSAVQILTIVLPCSLTLKDGRVSGVDLRRSYSPPMGLSVAAQLDSLDEILADETLIRPEHRLSFLNDESLVPLLKLKQLKRLSLTQAAITDDGLKTIAQIQQIEEVGLRKTLITDAGIKELSNTKTLTALDLRQTKITDTALRTLERLPNLKSVRLGGTEVTAEGVAALRKARPEMVIEF